MQDISYPIHDINLVLRACDPGEPLEPGDSRWYDFTPLRGTNVLQRLRRLLSAPPPDRTFHHQVLCGHRGSGKSTELLQLKAWADSEGFLAVRREVNGDLGQILALQFSDLSTS